MWKTEVTGFIVLFSVVFLLFVSGIIFFIFQYRKKKLLDQLEKVRVEETHRMELLNAQLQSQHQTMARIGREIHDNVGQKLTLASLYSKQLGIQEEGVNEKRVLEIADIIDESLSELRELSRSLTSTKTSETSLFSLLSAEAIRVNETGICMMRIEGNARYIMLSPAKRDILYRVLQEFLQNSLKHAECNVVTINLEQHNGLLLIKAKDDGHGFDLQQQSSGIGLKNMQQRIEEIGAKFSLTSSPGNGTSMNIELSTHEI